VVVMVVVMVMVKSSQWRKWLSVQLQNNHQRYPWHCQSAFAQFLHPSVSV